MKKIHTLLMNQNESIFLFSLSAQPMLSEGINLIDLFLPLGRMGLILNPLRRLPTDLPYRAGGAIKAMK